MSAFSVDAALEGFRFTRERPRAILPWAGLSFAANLVGAAILIGSGAEASLTALTTLRVDPADPSTVESYLSALGAAAPGLSIKLAVDFVVFSVLACSAFRALFAEDRRPKLALGRDELRMMALLLTLGAVNLAVLLVMSGLTGAATLLVGGAGSAAGQGVFLFGQIASLSLQALVMVRLALASPMCVAERRWSLADSWRRTRGRFWPMLGAFVIAALLFMVVAFLVGQLFGRMAALIRMTGVPAASGMGQLLDPAMLVVQAGVALALALGVPILAGPLAAAYRRFR